jgi:sec-independent protein translocase protein TatB
MFGMSLGEIFVIAIIAILFVGPDKLPDALVKIAKFFRNFKSTINEAKESFDRELQIKELKEEALNYKKQLQASVTDIRDTSGLDKLDDIYEEFNSINKSLELKDDILDDLDKDKEDEIKKEEQPKSKKKKKKKSKKKDEKLDGDKNV